MIRLVQRKLIIPRGDTGTFSVPVLSTLNTGDVAVFTIFNPLTHTKVYQKIIEVDGDALVIRLEHGDTVNLPVNKYVWDIKFYQNPLFIDEELVSGDEVDSYYAAYSLPECEIRPTGDLLLTDDSAPTDTIAPDYLNVLLGAASGAQDAKESAERDAAIATQKAELATDKADAASRSAEDAVAARNTAVEKASVATNAATTATNAKNSAIDAKDIAVASASTAHTDAINAAVDAASALDSASRASNAAATATEKANQIQNLTAEASTLSPGSNATASYSQVTGKLSLGIPRGADGKGIVSTVENADTSITITYTDNTTFTTTPLKGETGDAFHIVKTYASIVAMNADYSGTDVQIGEFVMIVSTIEDPDNAKVYVKGDQAYNFVVDMSGAAGINGVGISSIQKTSTSGTIDTYTIYYTNNTTSTFTVTNGTTPNISIGTVQEGPIAAASITGDTANPVLNLTLPNANVPTKVSQLENDSGYLTSEIDPTVPAWAKEANKPSYTATEVGLGNVANERQYSANNPPPSDSTKQDKIITSGILKGDGNGGVSAAVAGTDYIASHQDISDKADKVASATNGNFAALDANGNLTDSGHKHSDYLTEHQNIPVTDVQVNGTSVLSNGVANIPKATGSSLGVVKSGSSMGLYISSDGTMSVADASEAEVKAGTNAFRPVTPERQHNATFYGLAKASGDSTQSASDNAVGTYTDSAKISIQSMLDVPSQDAIADKESATATAAHAIGDLFLMSGKLYKATAAITIGDAIVTSGTGANAIQTNVVEEMPTVPVTDVQVNGTSVLSEGVANVPVGGVNIFGVYKVGADPDYSGIQFDPSGYLKLAPANSSRIKTGTNAYKPIVPSVQHESTFYGLAKAAGDSTQSSSSNSVGTYTDSAKGSIQKMLGIADIVGNEENNLIASKAYAVGDLLTANGKLYKVTAAIATDSAIVTSGTGANVTESSIAENNIKDIQVNGSSILSNGVANVPVASGSTLGTVKVLGSSTGIKIDSGYIMINGAVSASIKKASSSVVTPIVPSMQHESTFYGLAKAAGADMKDIASTTVGTYPDAQKAAIQHMLGTDTNLADYESDTTADQAYAIGELFMLNGKLHQATAAIAINDTFTVGTNCAVVNAADVFPHDVRVNGTSVLSNGVANIPVASNSNYGVVTSNPTGGITAIANTLVINKADDSMIKEGVTTLRPIVPSNQHHSVFYGLAKAAGDTTQSQSSNAVGTYTTEALAAIHTMLGIDPAAIAAQVEIPLVETVTGTTPTITGDPNTRYNCGEVTSISITPPASGSVDVIFTSGTTPTVLTVPNTVKFPAWFDATSLEVNTIYEILITDGVYGSVMSWAS